MKHATRNTAGCCDGRGQEHHVAGHDPHHVGALTYVSLCRDAACMARREAAWARECGALAQDQQRGAHHGD